MFMTISTSVLLAGVILAGCSATDDVTMETARQAAGPPDAVIFISGMS